MSGKSKALKKAAEAAGLLKQAEALPKAADIVGKGDLGFDAFEGDLRAMRAEQLETSRVKGITEESTFRGFDHQARTPEEFSARVPQFRNEAFVKGNLKTGRPMDNMPNPDDKGTRFNARWDRWQKEADQVHRITRTNPELTNWAGEGAYKRKDFFGPDVEDPEGPMTFFRMDIRQDPREGLSPIQFDAEANEFGMHIGSRQAGRDIISPNVTKDMSLRLTRVKKMMDDLAEQPDIVESGVDIKDLFNETFREVRTNMFLRHGEVPIDTPSADLFQTIMDDFWNVLRDNAKAKGVRELADAPGQEAFTRRMMSIMRYQYDPKQHPVLTNVKQGLLVQDKGSNTAHNIAVELGQRGIFDEARIDRVLDAEFDNAQQNILLRDLLRDEGYDHLVYINDAEDHGTMSIVLFDEDNYQNVLKPTKSRGGAGGTQAAGAMILAPLAAALGLDDDA